jgi:catechol 2,3-dioxygenase-like lactoylglutathione lyase family enzyme
VHTVSTFFTSYAALVEGSRVEAIAVVIGDDTGGEPTVRMLVVDEAGHASLRDANEVDMYGAYDQDDHLGARPPIEMVGIDHVQLPMPAGSEEEARAFYRDILGLREVGKPRELADRGGCWFAASEVMIHLGSEPDFRPVGRAHPALLVRDLETARGALTAAGVAIEEDGSGLRFRRCYVRDPFGNRIELVDARDAGFSER